MSKPNICIDAALHFCGPTHRLSALMQKPDPGGDIPARVGGEGWDKMIFKVPPKPNYSMIYDSKFSNDFIFIRVSFQIRPINK